MKWVCVALCVLAVSCSSSELKLYSEASAYDNYYTASYEHRCNPNPTEEPCKSCKEIINAAQWKLLVAKDNVDLKVFTPQERAELEQLIKDLQRCP